MCKRTERNLESIASNDIDISQRLWILPKPRLGFHYHMILVQWGVHGGYLTLAESVVEGVVNKLGGNVEPRCSLAIVLYGGVQPFVLLVTADIGELPQSTHSLE